MTTSLARSGYSETYRDLVSRLRLDCSRRRKSARRTSGNGSSSSAWPTPSAALHNDGEMPETFEARRSRLQEKRINGNGAGTPLTMAVKLWPPPAARDHKGANGEDHLTAGTGRLHLDQLPNFVAHLWSTPRVARGAYTRDGGQKGAERLSLEGEASAFSPRPQVTPGHGEPSSPSAPISPRQLNPAFVEWLMGWPPEWTDFGCSETEFARFKRLMRSELSRIASRPTPAPPPVQIALFQ